MNKKNFSRFFLIAAMFVIACPFVLEYVYRVQPKYIFRVIGIRFFLDQYWFYISGGFLFVAFYLQFPFREEEAWHCDCGYDLSYLNKKSKKCPECGTNVQFEWSPTPGTYSVKTTHRLYWAIFLFLGSVFMFGVGFLTKLFNSWANA